MRLRKPVLLSLAVLCLLSVLFPVECKVTAKAELTTLYVDDDNVTGPWNGTREHPYQSITNALEHAKDGDTIFVHNGTYYEHVVVNKSVSLLGEDRDSAIVDGNRTGNVISIITDYVSITGFNLKSGGMGPEDYGSGIFVDATARGVNISCNTIMYNYYGIRLQHSDSNTVSGNTITNNYDGISLYSSDDNMVSSNTVSSNIYGGISLSYSGVNVVSGNTITSNYNGITLEFSSDNVVSGNTIFSNNNYGVSLYGSSNTIYLNNFNNTNQVWSNSPSVWEDGKEGNYWSNYKGQDMDGDGIGDTPYAIDENNQDNHPLMGMFSDFMVALRRETYHVTTICSLIISEFRFEIGPETGNRIMHFYTTGKGKTIDFCRIRVPTELMSRPYIVLAGVEEIVPTLLDVSNETYVYLYFDYIYTEHTITIISSKTLRLYNELLDENLKLKTDLYDLNETYYDLLSNYSSILNDYDQLRKSHYQLNGSYQKHLLDYSQSIYNIRNLMYTFAATTAIFIMTTIYLSKHAARGARKT